MLAVAYIMHPMEPYATVDICPFSTDRGSYQGAKNGSNGTEDVWGAI